MAKKTKEMGAIPGFDAIAASCRWRRATSRKVRGMSSAERIAFFNRSLENEPLRPKPTKSWRTDSRLFS
jgi:hypothetical protein